MKRKGKILIALLIGLPVLLIFATSLLLVRQWQQDRLDNALFQALLHRDLAATTTALNQGANPNATYEIRPATKPPSGGPSPMALS